MENRNMTSVNGVPMKFFEFLRETEALQFGAYTLKSGRVSPYFFNSGRFDTGGRLRRLGEYFAGAIHSHAPQASVIFGPAYKGVPLCVAAAMALERLTGTEVGYLFDRKEEKGHGEWGRFVGRSPASGERVVMVDDVITDGETKLEAAAKLRASFEVSIEALVIAFDRMEVDAAGEDAVQRFEESTGIPVVSLMTLAELEQAIQQNIETGKGAGEDQGGETGGVSKKAGTPGLEVLEHIKEYRRRYGAERSKAGI